MKKAEYAGNGGFLQRDSVEHEEYAEAHSGERMETEEQDNAEDLMERILDRDNLNRAYRRVKSNKGAPGDRRNDRGRGAAVAEGASRGTPGKHTGRMVQAEPRKTEGDPEAGRWSQEVGDTDGGRPSRPAGDCTGTRTDL